MFKTIKRTLAVIAACVLPLLSFTACDPKNVEPITELNQTYTGSKMKITATDIKAMTKSDGILVGVRFIIENISKKDFILTIGNFSAYADDVTVDGTPGGDFNKDGERLEGDVASGKSAKGYYTVTAPKDTKQIEIRIKEEYTDAYATFIFDVPAVEET